MLVVWGGVWGHILGLGPVRAKPRQAPQGYGVTAWVLALLLLLLYYIHIYIYIYILLLPPPLNLSLLLVPLPFLCRNDHLRLVSRYVRSDILFCTRDCSALFSFFFFEISFSCSVPFESLFSRCLRLDPFSRGDFLGTYVRSGLLNNNNVLLWGASTKL